MDYIAGHLLGDILLQNKWLARIKMQKWWGMTLHCAISAGCVVWFCGWWDWRGVAALVSHWLIDTFALGKKWWPDLIKQGNPKTGESAPEWLRLFDDQAMHILCYFVISKL